MTPEQKKMRDAASKAHHDGAQAEATVLYARYLARHPRDAVMWSNLGVLHRTAGRHRQALRAHRRAIALMPHDLGLRNNLANVLSDIGQYDESIAIRKAILQDDPGNTNHLAMIGRCLRGKGDYLGAIDWLRGVIADHPGESEPKMQLAFAQLGAGQYAEAFETYRVRWEAGELTPRDVPFPEWKGEPLEGKTVLVLPEQGFGDAVLFTRFTHALKAKGATVRYLAEKPLMRLFAGLDGTDWVGGQVGTTEPIDYWINCMDLAPLHFAVSDAVPPPTKLTVPEVCKARAAKIVAPYDDVYKVGVIWTGSATYKGNSFRSFSHKDFLPLTDLPGVQLFSLYKGPYLQAFDADGSSGFIVDAGSSETDFADCAAMMQAMDLVITSDTATAHIAGSLGVPVWTILHWDPFWVWRHSGETTEWYPGMRLFRQQTPLEWDRVMGEVTNALRTHMGDGT